ncbi:MAG TPA: PAS domain S-box protein [Candidatus Cloacimonadota bacterium]|nr:PAS domain S-box protein [Candidatus Cloacimonadota bacterium]
MDQLDLVLCSPHLMEKLIPSFEKQIEEIISGVDATDKVKEGALNALIIYNHVPPQTHQYPDFWKLYQINAEQLNFAIQGTVTLRQLVNGIPIPIFLRNTKGQFIGCNPDFTDFMGIEEHELIGKTVYEIVPYEQAKEYDQRDKELIERPHIQIYEGKITRKNGETLDVIFRKTIILDTKQQASAIVGVIIDISKRKKIEQSNWEYRNKLEDMVLERTSNLYKANSQLKNEIELRKQSEIALRESEELFKTIFNSTYDGIILHDTGGNIVDVNDRFLEMFKVNKHELREYRIFIDFSSPVNNQEDILRIWDRVLDGESQLFEWRVKLPKGDYSFDTEVFLQKIEIGDRSLISANIRDISERKAVEKLLLKEHRKVKIALKHEMLLSTIATILNSTDKFFDVLDNLLNIIETTMHLTKTGFYAFQKEYTEMINRKIDFFETPVDDSYRNLINKMLMTLKNNQSIYYSCEDDITDITKSFIKSRYANIIVLMPIKISGFVYGALLFESDIAGMKDSKHYSLYNTISNMLANAWERYMLNQQRIEAEKQNIETIKLLESSSKLASIGVMAAGITHEINQPLNAIKILADGVLFWNKRNPDLLPDIFLQKIHKITQAVNRIDSIIKHMRSFWVPNAKASHHQFLISMAISNALDMISSQLSSHGIIVDLIEEAKDLQLQGDIIHLEQIIMNLCLNAMHALDKSDQQDKRIIIHTALRKDSILIQVKDNGPGIPEVTSERLFDPFYSTKKPGEGMGLGLAIVKQFVDNFKGHIHCYNQENGGAVFEITFTLNGS